MIELQDFIRRRREKLKLVETSLRSTLWMITYEFYGFFLSNT